MGDRTWTNYELRGTINSLSVFKSLCKVILDEGMMTHDGRDFSDVKDVAEYLATGNSWIAKSEANWAAVMELESICKEAGIPFRVAHAAGDNYERGGRWWSLNGNGGYEGDGPTLSIEDVETILKSKRMIADLTTAFAQMSRESGNHLWPFAISDHVIEEARQTGLLRSPDLKTITVRLVEHVTYEFDIEAPHTDSEDLIWQTAEEHFVQCGPQDEWVKGADGRTLLDWKIKE